MIPIFKLQPPWFLSPPLHRHGKAFDRAAGRGASWQKGRGEEWLRWWWRWRWMNGCLSVHRHGAAGRGASTQEGRGGCIDIGFQSLRQWWWLWWCTSEKNVTLWSYKETYLDTVVGLAMFSIRSKSSLIFAGVGLPRWWAGWGSTKPLVDFSKQKIRSKSAAQRKTVNNWCPNKY